MGLLADGWAFLDANSKQIGALSSIVFGVSSAIVAWLAYRLSRQNNRGLKPMVLVKSMGSFADEEGRYVDCDFEVWNRRKYPLVVRQMVVSFPGLKVEHGSHVHPRQGEKADWWSTDTGILVCRKHFSIDPSSHREFRAAGPIAKSLSWGAGIDDGVQVWVDVFDPIKNDHFPLWGTMGPEGWRDRLRHRLRRRLRRWSQRFHPSPMYGSSAPVRQGKNPDIPGLA